MVYIRIRQIVYAFCAMEVIQLMPYIPLDPLMKLSPSSVWSSARIVHYAVNLFHLLDSTYRSYAEYNTKLRSFAAINLTMESASHGIEDCSPCAAEDSWCSWIINSLNPSHGILL